MPALKKHAEPWTLADDAKLKRLAASGISATAAAVELGRTRAAVAYHAMVKRIRFTACEQPKGTQKRNAKKLSRIMRARWRSIRREARAA